MPIQTATTGNLENAQNIIIGKVRYTQENNAPCRMLIEHFTLPQGAKSMTIPKVGQVDAADLVDGVDMVDTQDIGMTTTDLTTAEVGLKFILTDKLVRQSQPSVFEMVGRQMGDAMARKVDEDIIALFSGLNGGTALGGDGKYLSGGNFAGLVSFSHAELFPNPVFFIHHPFVTTYLASNLGGLGNAATGITGNSAFAITPGVSQDTLTKFLQYTLLGIPVYQDGNIAKISGTDSSYGVIASKSAMCIIESQALRTERDRDISLRGTEVVVTSDYGVFELDDAYGAAARYEQLVVKHDA